MMTIIETYSCRALDARARLAGLSPYVRARALRATFPPRDALWLGDYRRHLSHRFDHRRRGRPAGRADPSVDQGIWLEHRQILSALAIRLVLFGLMAPFAAALIERYGVTRVVLTAITMIVIGLMLALVMSQAWHLIVLWGIVVGVSWPRSSKKKGRKKSERNPKIAY